MKKLKKWIFSPAATIVAFVLAAGLLLFSSVGGTWAALTYFSETYSSQVQMFDIGVTLVENGEDVSWRNYNAKDADGTWNEVTGKLLSNMLAEGEELALGKPYREELSVRNSGTINQYVRVSVYKYWVDENGQKLQNMDPSLIDLHYINQGGAWLLDEGASTDERTVLYYSQLLNAGDSTPLFSDTLTIDGSIATFCKQEPGEDGTVVTTYTYNGKQFCLEAKVDAVQENNAEAAILSAWGRNVVINGTSLSLG